MHMMDTSWKYGPSSFTKRHNQSATHVTIGLVPTIMICLGDSWEKKQGWQQTRDQHQSKKWAWLVWRWTFINFKGKFVLPKVPWNMFNCQVHCIRGGSTNWNHCQRMLKLFCQVDHIYRIVDHHYPLHCQPRFRSFTIIHHYCPLAIKHGNGQSISFCIFAIINHCSPLLSSHLSNMFQRIIHHHPLYIMIFQLLTTIKLY